MAEEETAMKKISPARAATLILLGAAIGATGDASTPSANNGTLSDIISDAALSGVTWGVIDKFLWKRPTSYALNSAGLIAFGSALGQTMYQYFKMY